MRKNMRVILIFILGLKLTDAVTHSYSYIYTGTSGIAGFPEFVVVGMVDGQQVNYFDTHSMKVVPRTDWVSGAVDPDFWNRNGRIFTGAYQAFKSNIEVLKQRFNQTDGVHSVQFMYGCELDDDGTKRGYMQYGYDGEDFLSLDKSTRTWTATKDQAMITKVKWEATGVEASRAKEYLENECIEWIQKYVGYGKETLEKKVSPQVSLFQKSSSSPVTCHATGFYPSGITITWQRNGQDHYEDVDVGELLPNEDGTFQKTSSIRIKPDEWKNNEYSCVVEHQGKTIREILKDESFPIAIIIGVVVALLLVVSGVIGYVVYRRKKGFKPVPQNQSDDGSNRS